MLAIFRILPTESSVLRSTMGVALIAVLAWGLCVQAAVAATYTLYGKVYSGQELPPESAPPALGDPCGPLPPTSELPSIDPAILDPSTVDTIDTGTVGLDPTGGCGEVAEPGYYPTSPLSLVKVTAYPSNVLFAQPLAEHLVTVDGEYRMTFESATGLVDLVVTDAVTGKRLLASSRIRLHTSTQGYYLVTPASSRQAGKIAFPSGGREMVFFRVGRVLAQKPTTNTTGHQPPYIENGLAQFPDQPAMYSDAPFGGELDIFGAFSERFYDSSADPKSLAELRGQSKYSCYQLEVTDATGRTRLLSDPLYKRRYRVENGKVSSTQIQVGPFREEGTGSNGGRKTVESCYHLTPMVRGDTFWDYPALLARWSTNGSNGKHTLRPRLYDITQGAGGKTIQEVALGDRRLELQLDNNKVQLSFDRIESRLGGSSTALWAPGCETDSTTCDACGIVDLAGTGQVAVEFTAHHPAGFLRNYSLVARSNSGRAVPFDQGAYGGRGTSGSPLFSGPVRSTKARGSSDFRAAEPRACAYILTLIAYSRTTDGYGPIDWAHRQKTYYIEP